jgi:hypothetical protein
MASAVDLIGGAFGLIGVLEAGQTIGGDLLADGYRRLQNMMGILGLQTLTAPTIGREVFALVAGKGGPSNPYTIGPTGDLVTTRPNALEGAGLLLAGPDPRVEIPRTLYTDDAYEALPIKDLPNALFTGAYYNAFAGNGTINLWPVPNTTLHALVLYRLDQIGPFASPTATYTLPPGYDEMLEGQLAKRLRGPYRRQLDPEVVKDIDDALAVCKRQNYKDNDLATDPALTNTPRTGYNIDTGQ